MQSLERLELRMAGAMDMAGKLPKIRDEERENRVRPLLKLLKRNIIVNEF